MANLSVPSQSGAALAPVKSFQVDALPVRVYASRADLARDAAREVHEFLRARIADQGQARVILATGNSQMQFLENLIALGGIDWSRVTLFHMDEYLGLAADHSASFRRYMRERVESRVKPKVFHYLEGDAAQPIDECDRYTLLLREAPIDLCCLGVGENGHLAFNDPPVADLADPRFVKIVQLDLACRQQQVGEGHFPNIPAVPQYALTLTIPALCAAKQMICIAPEKRKANAVKAALQGPISNACPASVLRRQPHATLLLDVDSASLL
ncbi:MAG: glucosamine-6-phosphate deaminase [Verrucomicrobia bacterium]|nr:glucosamine-6-phosphate deaminase [Verrucomicrobiota bacterium]